MQDGLLVPGSMPGASETAYWTPLFLNYRSVLTAPLVI
jgi:hypothetical protein